ncbi:hypothetical protein IC757_09500 [Wenzhouxiangella sp. AB-CW3]|uniref:hypothetical protein n=1 Tax=Wenzhouxiangella sp. AB-CW3 TaxID=2771012 RepID=UPI00168A71F3|nr:hypothetical protein [Wenzhouxiangella sp. AB-CW3]QOC21289.1 hypothetical protein IC757_09500 [Wenzhouxiangella sp. AB-CW3]
MTNLLEYFALAHTQLTRLNADLSEIVSQDNHFNAKVELKLTPLEMKHDGELPQYQVSARLLCRGQRDSEASDEPLFTLEFVLQAVYRQFRGEPVDFETFTRHHASLTRQLYPLIQHQLQPVLKQFGLDQVKLPHDLVSSGGQEQSTRQVH